MDLRNQAKELLKLGLNVGICSMELGADGKPRKYPVSVNDWVKIKSTDKIIDNWPRYKKEGVCIFTGDVEIIDVDSKYWKREGDFSQIFLEHLKHRCSFFESLAIYKTWSNGLGIPFHTEHAEGNQKISIVDGECIIETSGKGGLAVCPLTERYEWIDGGEWGAVPSLTKEQRSELFQIARDFNEDVPDEVISEYKGESENRGRPGDDWASKTDFIEWIKGNGWTVSHSKDGVVYLRRSGKDDGVSASWNYHGLGRFWCWSSSTNIPTYKLLKPFAVKAYIEYDGDFKACAKDLRKSGFGNDCLVLLDACQGLNNWGQIGGLLNDSLEIINKASNEDWLALKFGILAMELPKISDSKLDKMRHVEITKGDWTDKIIKNEDDRAKGLLFNLGMILKNEYEGVFSFDEFTQKIMIQKKLEYDDEYSARLRMRLSTDHGDFRRDDLTDAIRAIAGTNRYHPIKEKLESLEWDGVPRCETWLVDWCGAGDSIYTREVSKKWLVSAIARIYQPGCKVDTTLVLEGGQGSKKSSLLEKLSFGYFADRVSGIDSKDGAIDLFGKWIVEFSELDALTGKRSETVKSYISRQVDSIRLPYDKTTKAFMRTCVFVGSTNDGHYLHDSTGNRRFWPIHIKETNLELVNVDQLWAEAISLYKSGEKWWIDEADDIAELFRLEQGKRVVHSEISDEISTFLVDNFLCDDGLVRVKVKDVWDGFFHGNINKLDRKAQHEISDTLRKLGLKKVDTRVKGAKFKGYQGLISC